MPLDRKAKLEELKKHLVAMATISVELKADKELYVEEDGWTLPGSEFLDLDLEESPVSDQELVEWLAEKDDAVQSIHEREELIAFMKTVSETVVKLAPLLLAL